MLRCRDNFLIIVSGSRRLDFGAMGLTLVITLLLIWGIKETKTFNNSAHQCTVIAHAADMPSIASFCS